MIFPSTFWNRERPGPVCPPTQMTRMQHGRLTKCCALQIALGLAGSGRQSWHVARSARWTHAHAQDWISFSNNQAMSKSIRIRSPICRRASRPYQIRWNCHVKSGCCIMIPSPKLTRTAFGQISRPANFALRLGILISRMMKKSALNCWRGLQQYSISIGEGRSTARVPSR